MVMKAQTQNEKHADRVADCAGRAAVEHGEMPTPAMAPDAFLTDKEAAAMLRVSTWTLRAWRTNKRKVGMSPPYFQIGQGRVLYPHEKLKQWIAANMHLSSTTRTACAIPQKAKR